MAVTDSEVWGDAPKPKRPDWSDDKPGFKKKPKGASNSWDKPAKPDWAGKPKGDKPAFAGAGKPKGKFDDRGPSAGPKKKTFKPKG